MMRYISQVQSIKERTPEKPFLVRDKEKTAETETLPQLRLLLSQEQPAARRLCPFRVTPFAIDG